MTERIKTRGTEAWASLGGVMVMEDGSRAEVTPLREDRGALASLALLVALSIALIAHSLFVGAPV